MALEEVKIWATNGTGGATPLDIAHQMESERLLEDTLVNNPDMLMEGIRRARDWAAQALQLREYPFAEYSCWAWTEYGRPGRYSN